jgi:hypothetical protein
MRKPAGLTKRRYKRLNVTLDVGVSVEAYDRKTGLPERMLTACRNLSLDGLCLEAARLESGAVKLLSGPAVKRDYTLALELILTPGEPPLQVRGQVCWYNIDHSALDFIYKLGVEFVDLSPASRRTLKRFIRRHYQRRSLLTSIQSFFTRR